MSQRDYSRSIQVVAMAMEKIGGKPLTEKQRLALAGSVGVVLDREYQAGVLDGKNQACEQIGAMLEGVKP